MKELDVLLLRWLERGFSAASAPDRQNFTRLLRSEDDQLWNWFLGRSHSPDPELDELVQRIRGAA